MADCEDPKLTGLKLEYTSLQEQIIKRVEMRHKVVELTLTIAAAFFSLALTKEVPTSIALIFPPISFFLAMEWIYIGIRQHQTIIYLKRLEKKIPSLDLGWEQFRTDRGGFEYAAFSHGSCFIFTQILAIMIGFLGYDKDIINWSSVIHLPSFFILFLFIDCVCFAFTFMMIWERSRHHFFRKKS